MIIQSVTVAVIVYVLESNIYVTLCMSLLRMAGYLFRWQSMEECQSNSAFNPIRNSILLHAHFSYQVLCCNQTCDVSGHAHCCVTVIKQPIGTRGQKWDSAESPNQHNVIDNVMIAVSFCQLTPGGYQNIVLLPLQQSSVSAFVPHSVRCSLVVVH